MKTLKDMENVGYAKGTCYKEDLQEIAKDYIKQLELLKADCSVSYSVPFLYGAQIEWIKLFFDLEE